MSEHIARWTYLSQVIVQRATLVSILSLAVAGAIWSLAAAIGFAPWLRLDVGLGGASIDAGNTLLSPGSRSVSDSNSAETAASSSHWSCASGSRTKVFWKNGSGPGAVLR